MNFEKIEMIDDYVARLTAGMPQEMIIDLAWCALKETLMAYPEHELRAEIARFNASQTK